MGAPKQKWTGEEEAALKAGVQKHGAGKWQAILRDPEFSHVLRARSNVDLKDKWRNINVTLSGFGSLEKARLALERNPQTLKREDKPVASNKSVQIDEVKPPVASTGDGQVADPRRNFQVLKIDHYRLDRIILEALTTLKEPKGADKNAVSSYIQENYWAPPNLKKLLSSKLKFMAANGKLIKVNHRYRIASNLAYTDARISSSDDKQGDRLERIRGMTPEEAAALAAQAVAEAEAAIAAAEAAAREAEAAQIFAEATTKALKCQKLHAC